MAGRARPPGAPMNDLKARESRKLTPIKECLKTEDNEENQDSGQSARKATFVNFVSFCLKDFISDLGRGKTDFDWFIWSLRIHNHCLV